MNGLSDFKCDINKSYNQVLQKCIRDLLLASVSELLSTEFCLFLFFIFFLLQFLLQNIFKTSVASDYEFIRLISILGIRDLQLCPAPSFTSSFFPLSFYSTREIQKSVHEKKCCITVVNVKKMWSSLMSVHCK